MEDRMPDMRVKAIVKHSFISNGTAVITIEIGNPDAMAIEVMRRTGEEMHVTFTPEQQTMTIDEKTGEVY